MQTLADIKRLLAERSLAPKKSLGQNFLIDHNLIRKLVDASGVAPGEVVLEVGPGTGTLTEELLDRGAIVIACEMDSGLADLLRERLSAGPHAGRFTLVHRDCLEGKREIAPQIAAALAGRPFKLVANLPYGAATPLMMTLMLDHPACATQAVTVQREVIDRLVARPGTGEYGGLSVLAQSLCRVTRIATLPPECFWPRPEVTSGMVLLQRRESPGTFDAKGLSEFCRVVFAQRRKQLGSVLKAAGGGPDWEMVSRSPGCEGIVPTLRAEQLSPDQFESLRSALHNAPAGDRP